MRTLSFPCAVLLVSASAAYGQFVTPTNPLQPLPAATFCGAGIPNNAVATTTITNAGNTIVLGLSATARNANPVVTDNGAGTYFAAIGADADPDPNRARWNFNFHISALTGGGASALNQYVFELFYDMDPGATPIASLGRIVFTGPTPGCGATVGLIHDSWNLGFDFLRTAFPGALTPPAGFQNPGGVDFAPTTPGQYSFLLRVSTPGGVVLGEVAINVSTQGVLLPTPPSVYQLRYFSNLNAGDSVINITNDGSQGAGLAAGTAATTIGSICANIYTFSPDEQMVSCCSCPVTPNGLASLSVRGDLVNNTLTPAVPTSVVVKMVGSLPSQGSCTNSATSISPATLARLGGELASGLRAWGTTTTLNPGGANQLVETPFAIGTLSMGANPAIGSIGELGRLNQLCSFIVSNGSGFGICNSCRLGGLGGTRR